MAKKNQDSVAFTIHKTFKAKLTGDAKAVRAVLDMFVRGATEKYIEEQNIVGRSREEILEEMHRRIRIAQRHQELGETDGFNCDLGDA